MSTVHHLAPTLPASVTAHENFVPETFMGKPERARGHVGDYWFAVVTYFVDSAGSIVDRDEAGDVFDDVLDTKVFLIVRGAEIDYARIEIEHADTFAARLLEVS